MKHLINIFVNILLVILILFFLMFCASFMDIIIHNVSTTPQYADWNIIIWMMNNL